MVPWAHPSSQPKWHLDCFSRFAGLTIVTDHATWLVTHNHNHFTTLFPGPPGWAGARRELLDFMVQGKINRGRHTDQPAGRHSIQSNQCPPPTIGRWALLVTISRIYVHSTVIRPNNNNIFLNDDTAGLYTTLNFFCVIYQICGIIYSMETL